MKNISLLFLILITLSCTDTSEKTKGKVVYNKQFNWTIAIPDGFTKQTDDESVAQQERGAEMIENTYDQEIVNLAHSIFVFKKDETNYFESNYQPYDTAVDGNYLESCQAVNEIIYHTFMSQMEDVSVDSSSSTQLIDGLLFQQFNIIITFPNEMVLTTHMYSHLFDENELTVNIMYVDEDSADKMKNAWLNSTFK